MKILIDNGHGCDTPGKRSPDGKFREWLWNREVAQMLEDELREMGINCQRIVTEPRDIPLAERCKRVNSQCDIFGKGNVALISIHANAAGADGMWHSARGWSAYTTKGATKADHLADCLYMAAAERLKEYAKTFKPTDKAKPIRTDLSDGDADWEENFYILRHTQCPAVLVENMFYDNKADCEWLLKDASKRLIASLIAEGVKTYIEENGKG